MNDISIDLILDKTKFPKTYNASLIIITILGIFLYIIFTYKYQTYYISQGKIKNNQIELLVNLNDIKYIQNSSEVEIEGAVYKYRLVHIDNNLYVDDNYQNYQYLYIEVAGIHNIDNYVYKVKIPKENKTLAKYLIKYL